MREGEGGPGARERERSLIGDTAASSSLSSSPSVRERNVIHDTTFEGGASGESDLKRCLIVEELDKGEGLVGGRVCERIHDESMSTVF